MPSSAVPSSSLRPSLLGSVGVGPKIPLHPKYFMTRSPADVPSIVWSPYGCGCCSCCCCCFCGSCRRRPLRQSRRIWSNCEQACSRSIRCASWKSSHCCRHDTTQEGVVGADDDEDDDDAADEDDGDEGAASPTVLEALLLPPVGCCGAIARIRESQNGVLQQGDRRLVCVLPVCVLPTTQATFTAVRVL